MNELIQADTMRKLQGIEACRNCVSRDFVNAKGLVCKRTGNVPDAEAECTDFQLDEELVKIAPIPEQEPDAEYNAEELLKEENLPKGIVSGLAACILGAALWALVSVSTGYQIGYMAVGMGFLVGYMMRIGGKGVRRIFGITGALLALLGCILGDYFSMIGYIANEYNLPYFETLASVDQKAIASLMIDNLLSMTALFYGIAIFEGYKLSFRVQFKEGGKI